MDQLAQDIAPSHVSLLGERRGESGGASGAQVQSAAWPPRVVLGHALAEHPVEVTPAEDEGPIQALASDGPHPSLGERVRPRRSERGKDAADAVGREDGVEAPHVLRVPLTDQDPERPTLGEVE